MNKTKRNAKVCWMNVGQQGCNEEGELSADVLVAVQLLDQCRCFIGQGQKEDHIQVGR